MSVGRLADTIPFSSVDGPGNRFVVFFQGCNFDCIACHNPQTIGYSTPRTKLASVDEVLDELRPAAPFLSGVTASGGEATQQAEFLIELFAAIRADPGLGGLTTMIDTNGSAPTQVWDDLLPVTDGVMVDLKAYDPALHRDMTGQPNSAVLDTILLLAARGRLHEIRLLLVPGVNDDPALLTHTADWIRAVDPEVPVKLIGFRRHGVRGGAAELPEPTPEQMQAYCDIFTAAGLSRLSSV